MMIGEQKHWWNRRVPILRIGAFAVAGTVLLGLIIWVFYGENVAWDIRHRRTASFRGHTLQVPWLWREEEWTNYNKFELTRNHLLPNPFLPIFPTSVTVSYQNRSPADIQMEIDAIRTLDAKLTHRPGDYFDPDGLIDSHFVCTDKGSSRSEFEWINCFSRDGRWRVLMLGLKQDRTEFSTILRGVNAMGAPSK